MIALAAFAIVLPGAALAARAPVSRALRAALVVAFGLGVWSATFLALLFAGLGEHRAFKDVALVALSALSLWRAPRVSPRVRPDPPPRWLVAAFAGAALLALALFVEHVWRQPDGGWDAW